MAWTIEGEYLENCNCEVVCPCIVSMELPADNERCRVPIACHIESGKKDDVSLDGLNFILLIDSPQVMAHGDWRVAVYIDERADDSQREALGAILSGAEGGQPESLGPLLGEQLGVKFVPINWESSNGRKRIEVPGIMEFEVEGFKGADDKVIEISNVAHPMGSDFPIAHSIKGTYDDPDYGLSFDNTGKNAHYRAFAWSG